MTMGGTARVAQPIKPDGAPALPDAVLVEQAQRDRRAFAPLYARYFDAIFRFCFYRIGDWQDAEDAAGEVFARALGDLGRFRLSERHDGFRCWLFVIARGVVANRHRHRARHPDRPLAEAADLLDTAPTPEDLALAAADHRLLADLLARLKLDERELLELRLAGLNDAEIARVLGRSHGAVRQEQWRTIQKQRALLGVGDRREAVNA
jgi:RNA polymerase sigma-70 factor (ECF subfamily)